MPWVAASTEVANAAPVEHIHPVVRDHFMGELVSGEVTAGDVDAGSGKLHDRPSAAFTMFSCGFIRSLFGRVIVLGGY